VSADSQRQAGRTDGAPERTDRQESPGTEPSQNLGTALGAGAAVPKVEHQVEHQVASSTESQVDDRVDGHGRAGSPRRRGVRVRTVVFGLILLAISVSVLVTLLTKARVDATAVTFVVLIGAGAALVAGGLAAAVREARGGPGS
jgi:hypothetical protein